MIVNAPSKICLRCNTALPASAPYCGRCGYQFSLMPGPVPGVTPGVYGPAPAGWPQPQPGYPAPGAAAPKRGVGKWIALLLVLVVLVGGAVAAWGFVLSPSHCSGPFFDRHGLQSNVPLPSGCVFKQQRIFTSDPTSGTQVTADEWFWTTNSPNDPAAVQQFYDTHLAANGWTEKHPAGANASTDQALDIYACQGNQALVIETAQTIPVNDAQGNTLYTVEGPSGGAALAVVLTSSKEFIALICG